MPARIKTETGNGLVGTLITKRVARGSKSERDAYFLKADDGKEWGPLRVPGENAFEQPTLRALLGARLLIDLFQRQSGVYLLQHFSKIVKIR